MTANLENMIRDRLVVVALPTSERIADSLMQLGARDVLLLSPSTAETRRTGRYVRAKYSKPSSVIHNNCDVAVLFGRSALALSNRRFFRKFQLVVLPLGLASLASAIGLLRYGGRVLRYLGTCSLGERRRRTYLVFENTDQRRTTPRRHGPADTTPSELLRELADLDCVVLRWAEPISNGTHTGDVDLLASHSCLGAIESRLSRAAGTLPIDLYADNGHAGHAFKDVPYFPPLLARQILTSAQLSPEGFRVPSPEMEYVAFCFHILFHKSNAFPPGLDRIAPETIGNRYYDEMTRLAEAANVFPPVSFHDIETLLKGRGVFPQRDTIGFYSVRNPFLVDRYFREVPSHRPGLAVFLVRDFGFMPPVDEIRSSIVGEGFNIVLDHEITASVEPEVLSAVRGGNWSDPAAPNGTALPVHLFLCVDPAPLPPTRRILRKYPRLDNRRLLIKEQLRRRFGAAHGRHRLNLIHATDNSSEAVEYVEMLGLTERAEIDAVLNMFRVGDASR